MEIAPLYHKFGKIIGWDMGGSGHGTMMAFTRRDWGKP
jgi:hypothetical protein